MVVNKIKKQLFRDNYYNNKIDRLSLDIAKGILKASFELLKLFPAYVSFEIVNIVQLQALHIDGGLDRSLC